LNLKEQDFLGEFADKKKGAKFVVALHDHRFLCLIWRDFALVESCACSNEHRDYYCNHASDRI